MERQPYGTVGAAIREQILQRHQITQEQLAAHLLVSRQTINELCNGRRALTADMAVRLSMASRRSPLFWMLIQVTDDIKKVRVRSPEVDLIAPLRAK